MKCTKAFALFLAVGFFSCDNTSQREKDVQLRERELAIKEKEIALSENIQAKIMPLPISSVIKMAEGKFKAYGHKIEKSYDGVFDLIEPYTGDFTGDGKEDVLIYFSLSPSGGGNALVGQGLTLYQNMGNDVKVIAGYEPDYLFHFDKISGGKIYVVMDEYDDGDGRCCPSIHTNIELVVRDSKIYERNLDKYTSH